MDGEEKKMEIEITYPEDAYAYNYVPKIVVIGDVGVGKTSLINQIVTNNFNEFIPATIGIDFAVIHIRLKPVETDEVVFKFRIWDCAGQERYKSLTRQYIRNATIILYTFDLTNRMSFAELHEWKDTVRKEIPNNEYLEVVIGNKKDNEKNREVSYDEGEQFAHRINAEYFEVSARYNESVTNLFKNIAYILYKKIITKTIVLSQNCRKTLDILSLPKESTHSCWGHEKKCIIT